MLTDHLGRIRTSFASVLPCVINDDSSITTVCIKSCIHTIATCLTIQRLSQTHVAESHYDRAESCGSNVVHGRSLGRWRIVCYVRSVHVLRQCECDHNLCKNDVQSAARRHKCVEGLPMNHYLRSDTRIPRHGGKISLTLDAQHAVVRST